MLRRFEKSGHLDDEDYIIDLPPIETAKRLAQLVKEANDEHSSNNFFAVYREAEEKCMGNMDFILKL